MMRLTSSWPAIFTLQRADGARKTIRFAENEPGWTLIKATTNPNGRLTPRLTDLDRFDYNERHRQAWDARCWRWLSQEMANFSNGEIVQVCRDTPVVIGGYVPFV